VRPLATVYHANRQRRTCQKGARRHRCAPCLLTLSHRGRRHREPATQPRWFPSPARGAHRDPPTMEAPNAAAPKGPCASHRRTNAITCRRPEALHRETPPPPMKNHAASPPRGLLDLPANDQTSACTKEVGDSTPPYQPPRGPPTAGLNNHQHRDGEPEAKPQIWLAVDIGPT
jgi:hypothetical protein